MHGTMSCLPREKVNRSARRPNRGVHGSYERVKVMKKKRRKTINNKTHNTTQNNDKNTLVTIDDILVVV